MLDLALQGLTLGIAAIQDRFVSRQGHLGYLIFGSAAAHDARSSATVEDTDRYDARGQPASPQRCSARRTVQPNPGWMLASVLLR